MQKFTSEEARTDWRHLLDSAMRGGHCVIKRHGEPTAAVVPWDWYTDALSMLSAGAPKGPEAQLLAEAREAERQ